MICVAIGACTVDRSGLAPPDRHRAEAGLPPDGGSALDGRPPDRPAPPDGRQDGGPSDAPSGDAVHRDAIPTDAEPTDADRDAPCTRTTWYRDRDGDGFGDGADEVSECTAPLGYTPMAGDCDDDQDAVNPMATESCNGVDDDCDGTIDGDAGCPCTIRWRSGRPYLFCNDHRSWDAARNSCTSVGYDLAVVNDAPENEWVWAEGSAMTTDDWWIGLRDWNDDGTYEWVDGTSAWDMGAVGYTNFRDSGAPDGSGPCVEMGNESGTSMDGAWNDVACDQETHFVCEGP